MQLSKKKIKIAYSICGVGHGHYGRNVEIIKLLSKKIPNSEITLYLYGDTWNIFSMDKNIPENIRIKKIPGFQFFYNSISNLNSLSTTLTNGKNWAVFLKIMKMDFLNTAIFPMRKLWAQIIKKPDILLERYQMKYFDDFDFAIIDFEPLLPRIADIRKKPFITLDNQHTMLFSEINTKKFTYKERLELFFIKWILRVYHPFSDSFILSSFFKLPIKRKFRNWVKEVGPIIRDDIINAKDKISYDNYILIYAQDFIKDLLFPTLKKIKNTQFVVFTSLDNNEKFNLESCEQITVFKIDPELFVQYLTHCKAVISTAGNTLISEAIYLKKPYFAISLEGNFEQRLNLYMLETSHWGKGCRISDYNEKKLMNFINNTEFYQNELKNTHFKNNQDIVVQFIINKMEQKLYKN